ncbi:nuclear transport factor 2 family protein [Paraburkholderia silviterrae]|uniref:Nuclear transport factor 2 family protein n=1 Tax=Paraburkholderia silviterrae TaxID=2528715 RepID=A0A4R5M9G1_9BURK|nr:nuclear transport factor 2 family protein [Paraburkholderia silviterrae]TDG22389.1 nuclear transport factor 2 family protein [Paraburkholderia silviterrae]
MKHLFAFAAACVAATAAFASVPSAPVTNEAIQLQILEHQWTQAAANGDRSMLNDLLDDKFLEILPNGTHRSKRDLLAAVALPPGGSQVLEDVRVQVLGDLAVVTGINRYTPARGFRPIEYRFADVFMKREDGWRVVGARMRRKESGSI